MEAIGITELRNKIKQYFDKVADSHDILIITRPNEKAVVLMSLDEFNSIMETAYLLNGENGKRLRASVEQLKKGKVVKYEF